MKRIINILSVVLGAQLLLAAVLAMTTGGTTGAGRSAPLLQFDTKAVDHLSIAEPGKDALVLVHKDGAWQIPALGDFPAAKTKVDGLIAKLSTLHKRIPVATSAAAAKRFKVSPEAYAHKLVLATGEKALATLWLGDSQNFRRVYGRAEGEDAIYDLELAAYETSADTDGWTDKGYLNLKPEDITAVTLPGFTLRRKDDTWQVEGLAEGEQTNTEEASSLVRQIANLSYLSVLGKEDKPEYKQDKPVVTVKLSTQSGERSYLISKSEKGADYVLKSSTSPYYFKVADFAVKELVEGKREKLVKGPEKPRGEEKAAAPAGQPSAPASEPAAAPAGILAAPAAAETASPAAGAAERRSAEAPAVSAATRPVPGTTEGTTVPPETPATPQQ
jgi:hypothetical protein